MTRAYFYGLGLATALGLKIHYSVAGAEDLHWMLLPTAKLVEAWSGLPFVYEKHAGFINRAEGVIIAPACAGINYLIIAFCSFNFSLVSHVKANGAKLACLGLSLCLAYVVTLAANAVRIIFSIALFSADIYGGWVTPERVHRIEGTVIYLLFLLGTYLILERTLAAWRPGKGRQRERLSPEHQGSGHLAVVIFVPFFWYALVTIGAPLVRSPAKAQDPQFIEHSLLLLAVGLAVISVFFSIQWLGRAWPPKEG